MAFEYSTQGATLDFPNPYRIKNQFLAARGLVLLASGVWLLILDCAKRRNRPEGRLRVGAYLRVLTFW